MSKLIFEIISSFSCDGIGQMFLVTSKPDDSFDISMFIPSVCFFLEYHHYWKGLYILLHVKTQDYLLQSISSV